MSTTRQHLIQTATRLIAQHGYDGIGVQQLVAAAGVTKPTLYHHFGSKQGVIEAILAETGGQLLRVVKEAATYQGDITQSITRVVQAYFHFARQQPDFYRLLLTMWFAPPDSEYSPAVDALLNAQFDLLSEMFIAATRNHGNMAGRHRQYALSLRGLVDTYIGVYLQRGGDLPDEDHLYRIVHQYMHGIFS
jgi:TetR/AcrR family transcriptional regulator